MRAEVVRAIADLEAARSLLDWADPSDPDAVDAAIYAMAAAERRFAMVWRSVTATRGEGRGGGSRVA